jgi:hypothetical protein
MTREEQRRINIEQAAKRAKAEAEARATAQTEASLPKEVGGRKWTGTHTFWRLGT